MLTLEHLADLAREHAGALNQTVREFNLGPHRFAFNSQPAIMGVINLSPDSWYRESVALSVDAAVRRGRVLAAQGATIIDIGAESTLAHAERVDAAGQNRKLLPVIEVLSTSGIVVSAETYQPEVARAALAAGARVLNLTGTTGTEAMFRLVAEHNAAVIVCFVQGDNVREVGDFDFGADTVALMEDYFGRQIELATRCGVERIILDPGLGFYYRNLQDSTIRIRHQMRTFLHSFRLRKLGCPICHALPHAFECFQDEVRSAEPFFAVLAALGRTDLFRTHEVTKVRAVLQTLRSY